jgi:hypothetical protein
LRTRWRKDLRERRQVRHGAVVVEATVVKKVEHAAGVRGEDDGRRYFS